MKLLITTVDLFLAVALSHVAHTIAFAPLKTSYSSSTFLSAGKRDEDSKEAIAKRAALDGVLSNIERTYGRGSIQKLGDADHMLVDSISTGALTLGQ